MELAVKLGPSFLASSLNHVAVAGHKAIPFSRKDGCKLLLGETVFVSQMSLQSAELTYSGFATSDPMALLCNDPSGLNDPPRRREKKVSPPAREYCSFGGRLKRRSASRSVPLGWWIAVSSSLTCAETWWREIWPLTHYI